MGNEKDLIRPWCVVCGMPASNLHHEPPKRLGGVGRKGTEPPRLSLCGSGTTGCHGMRHAGKLEFRRENGFWEWRTTGDWMRCIDLSEEEFGW